MYIQHLKFYTRSIFYIRHPEEQILALPALEQKTFATVFHLRHFVDVVQCHLSRQFRFCLAVWHHVLYVVHQMATSVANTSRGQHKRARLICPLGSFGDRFTVIVVAII